MLPNATVLFVASPQKTCLSFWLLTSQGGLFGLLVLPSFLCLRREKSFLLGQTLSLSFSSNVRTPQIWPQNPFLEEISLTIERAVPLIPQSCTLIHALSPCWSWCHGLMCYRKCVCLAESVTSSSSSHLPLLTDLYARSCLCSCYDWVCTVGSFRHLLVDNLKQKLFLNRQ